MSKTIEPVVNVNDVSRISAGTILKGEISSPNDIRIDGEFVGKIYSKGKVVVGENASITGDVICQNVDFWGVMHGNFYVKDTLSLKDSCKVEGDLHVRRLQVELNASFNGNCKMISEVEFNHLAESVVSTKLAGRNLFDGSSEEHTSVHAPAVSAAASSSSAVSSAPHSPAASKVSTDPFGVHSSSTKSQVTNNV